MSQNSRDLDVEGGGSARGLLVLGLLGGLLVGGGLAYYFLKDQLPSGDDSAAESVAEEEKEPLQSIRFERLTVPIYTRSGSRARYIGNFFINIDVLVRGEENLIAVRRSEPQLQHAFISAISNANLMQEQSPEQLDMEKTARILKERANQVLGADAVADVSVVEALRIPN